MLELGVAPCWRYSSERPCIVMQVDQCTVNEYPAGVGLSPHIDTHSAFSGKVSHRFSRPVDLLPIMQFAMNVGNVLL